MGGHIERISGEIADILLREGIDRSIRRWNRRSTTSGTVLNRVLAYGAEGFARVVVLSVVP